MIILFICTLSLVARGFDFTMMFRLRFNVLLSILCFFLLCATSNAWALCAPPGSASNLGFSIQNTASQVIRDLKEKTNNRLEIQSNNTVEALQAAAQSATNNAATAITAESKLEDADNMVSKKTLVDKLTLESAMETEPIIEQCRSITAQRKTLQMEALTRAAEKSMNRDSRKNYTNDVNSPFSKGVTSALALQFMEYMSYYCNPKANNGKMPDSEHPLSYTYPDDVTSPRLNEDETEIIYETEIEKGTTLSVFCGSRRQNMGPGGDILIDADIRVGDIMFGDTTWPMNNGETGIDYGNKIYAAAQRIGDLLSPLPRDPYNPSIFKTSDGINAFMNRRAFEARSALVRSQFNYINAKRVPTSNGGGIWMKKMLAKELAPQNVLEEDASDLIAGMNDECNVCTDANPDNCTSTPSTEGTCGLWQLISKIPDNASKNEYMNFLMRDRFLGADYLSETSTSNETQSLRLLINLMSLSMIQENENKEIMERMLGTMAAKYALRVDQTAQSSGVDKGQ